MEVSLRKATKRPLEKMKTSNVSKEDLLIYQALVTLQSKTASPEDSYDYFGKNVACSLRKMNGEQHKEHTMLKIQEILDQVKCVMISHSKFSFSPSRWLQSQSCNYPFLVLESNSPATTMHEQ